MEMAAKMNIMTQKIVSLEAALDEKELLLHDFNQDIGQFQNVGHLKAFVQYLTEQLDDNERDILNLHQEFQKVQVSNQKLKDENEERIRIESNLEKEN